MQTAREKAIGVIKQMPSNATMEMIIDRLKLIHMVDRGIEDLDDGNTISQEDAKTALRRWLE